MSQLPFTLVFLVKACLDSPDLGSTSGIQSYDWDENVVNQTRITYTCPAGQAFDGKWKNSITSKCTYNDNNNRILRWKYNSEHPLPNCIRKFIVSVNIFSCNPSAKVNCSQLTVLNLYHLHLKGEQLSFPLEKTPQT